MKEDIVFRPWGTYRVLKRTPKMVAKILHVYAGRSMSVQYHNFREEHWKILEGQSSVLIDDRWWDFMPGARVYIPKRTIHCVRASMGHIRIFEVWNGEKLDENDIIRVYDDYNS
jgi:mannose-6-phosphate isomerase-like protein (cupin superfamily)|tara:strand:- start:10535 stop:10876 length:342 start_codon:yes stop_codon:yes gene_type:complete